MTHEDDEDVMSAEEIAEYEEDTFRRVLDSIYSTIWIYTRPRDVDDDDGIDGLALRKRILDAITEEGVEEFQRQREAEAEARDNERTRKDTAVVRKPNDIGATWHRPLTEHSVVCGKPIPEDAVHGNIGDPDVYRTFLCRACLNAGDNLFHLRYRRLEKERRRR